MLLLLTVHRQQLNLDLHQQYISCNHAVPIEALKYGCVRHQPEYHRRGSHEMEAGAHQPSENVNVECVIVRAKCYLA